jgi:hypothetical protein
VRCDETLAREFLEHWRERGVAEERLGRWRLTERGRAMFGAWAGEIELDETEAVA